jgi:hypothetical protein
MGPLPWAHGGQCIAAPASLSLPARKVTCDGLPTGKVLLPAGRHVPHRVAYGIKPANRRGWGCEPYCTNRYLLAIAPLQLGQRHGATTERFVGEFRAAVVIAGCDAELVIQIGKVLLDRSLGDDKFLGDCPG